MYMTAAERVPPPSPVRADVGRSPFVRLRELIGDAEPCKPAISLAVGEPQDVMLRTIAEVELPVERPRYLMGVGTPEDLVEAVARGIDMFDCVLPTRNGRHGLAFTRFGPITLKNARHADDPRPLDEESPCPAARSYSRAYLHHLVRSGETLGAMLLSEINVAYYQHLMQGMRDAIADGRFEDFQKQTRAGWARGDIDLR